MLDPSKHLGLYISAFDGHGARVGTAAEHLANEVWTVNLYAPQGEIPERVLTVGGLRAVIQELKAHGGETLIVCPAGDATAILERFARG